MSGKYLTLKDRRLIAKRYNEEARVLDIANEIGCHPDTIYEELRRGATGRLDARQRPEYDPLIAQRAVQEAIRRRGNRRTARHSIGTADIKKEDEFMKKKSIKLFQVRPGEHFIHDGVEYVKLDESAGATLRWAWRPP